MSPRRAKAVSGLDGDPATALREHLIDVAERLLSERQVSTITTRDIARTAGVSDGVLYNYFSDKNDLLLTALVRRYTGIVTRFEADLPEPGTGAVRDNLNAHARALLDLQADALPLAAGLITEPSLLRQFIDAIHREPLGPLRVLHHVAGYLAGEQRLGRLPAVDVEAATTLIFGATVMLAFTSLMGGASREDLARQVPAIVDTLIDGLDPPSARRRTRKRAPSG
jgi:AcrR family transcriptional regulator